MKKLFITLISILLLASCQQQNSSVADRIFYTGEDAYGRTVVLKEEPQRIISLSSSITEIAFLIGAESKIVGVSDFCEYPPEVEKIPKVGKLLNINVENLLALHPDLVLITSHVTKEDVAKIENAGIPVFSVKAEDNIEGLFYTIDKMGDILNRQKEATSLAADYRHKIDSLQQHRPEATQSVYYVVGFGKTGDFTAPGNSYIHDIITLAGGRNIGEYLTTWSVNREHLFEQDPDLIFIREEDLETFCSTYPYTLLTAVKEHRVYPIHSGWIDTPSPRNMLAIEYINRIIINGNR